MAANLASLPHGLHRMILDFCNAQDVVTLSSTCRKVHRELGITVISADYKISNLQFYDTDTNPKDPSAVWPFVKIPIFFPNHFHSARLTCHVCDVESFRLYVVAQPPKGRADYASRSIVDMNGNTALVLWESSNLKRPPTQGNYSKVDIDFRAVPYCQEYSLWCRCMSSDCHISDILLKKILLWNDSAAVHRKATFNKCMELLLLDSTKKTERHENDYRIYDTDVYQLPGHAFLADLFHWTVEALSETQRSPLHALFELKVDDMNGKLTVEALKTFSNIYYQLVEQKEPEHCKVLPLVDEYPNEKRWIDERKRYCDIPLRLFFSCNNYSRHSKDSRRKQVVDLNPNWEPTYLTLEFDSEWVPSDCMKWEVLQFVARIPLVANTRMFRLEADHGTEFPGSSTFFLFPSFLGDPPNGLKDKTFGSMNHYYRHHRCVITLTNITYHKSNPFRVDFTPHPDATAYFLYFVPNPLSLNSFSRFKVRLERFRDKFGTILEDVTNKFLHTPYRVEKYPVLAFPFRMALLRATAMTVMNCNGPKYNALAEFLERQGFSTTPQGLECIVQMIDSMAEQRLSTGNCRDKEVLEHGMTDDGSWPYGNLVSSKTA